MHADISDLLFHVSLNAGFPSTDLFCPGKRSRQMASYKVDSLASPADLGHSDKQSESGRAKQLQLSVPANAE